MNRLVTIYTSNKLLCIEGVLLGVLASALGIMSASLLDVFSWGMLLFAIWVGYYAVKRNSDPSKNRFQIVLRSSLLIVTTITITSFLINGVVITYTRGWGLDGINLVSATGLISLLLGLLTGYGIQLLMFVLLGMVGALFQNLEFQISERRKIR